MIISKEAMEMLGAGQIYLQSHIFSGHIILNKELAPRFQCGENIFSGHIILNIKLAPGFRGGEVTEYFGCTSHTVSPAMLLKLQTKFKIEIELERFTPLRNKKNVKRERGVVQWPGHLQKVAKTDANGKKTDGQAQGSNLATIQSHL